MLRKYDFPVADPDLELRNGEGREEGGRFCFACPAGFSSFLP